MIDPLNFPPKLTNFLAQIWFQNSQDSFLVSCLLPFYVRFIGLYNYHPLKSIEGVSCLLQYLSAITIYCTFIQILLIMGYSFKKKKSKFFFQMLQCWQKYGIVSYIFASVNAKSTKTLRHNLGRVTKWSAGSFTAVTTELSLDQDEHS